MRFHPCGYPHPYVAVALVLVGVGAWAQSTPAQEAQPRPATKVEYEGWRQYMITCARCHGDDAVGGVMAPDLRAFVAKDTVNQTSFHATVSEGRLDKGMPGFKGVMSAEQIDAIYAYVVARAKGNLPAGRPKQ
jgi:mono/diheme cytochrome c family protein